MESLLLLPSTPLPLPANLRHSPLIVRHRSNLPITATSLSTALVTTECRPISTSNKSTELKKVSTDSLKYESGYLGGISEKTRVFNDEDSDQMALRYLTDILSSRVYDVAVETPLQFANQLSERIGVNIWLKREDMQPVFSFKVRGAYHMMSKLSKEQLRKGVICSSAGNHAQGVAMAAQRLGCDAIIAMPITTPDIKWKAVERLGAKVVLVGEAYDESQAYAKKRAMEEGRTFIPPFDHPDIVTGQGTVGMEIVRQFKGPLHAVFVPVGGGGLISGIAAYMKRVRPDVKIIGVEPTDANTLALSLHHGERVMLEQVGGFADGVALSFVGEAAFRICREYVDGVVLVSRDAICASIKDMFEEKRSILEPSGALALAGAEAYCKYYNIKDESIVVVTTGANMNFDRLRLVTELADIGRKREAVLATFLPEKNGSFKQFAELVGSMNITEFKYRYNSCREDALVFYSVGVHTERELSEMLERMKHSKLETVNLTNNDLVKDHLRHLMGGRLEIGKELLCKFIFPEKPGALMEFLNTFSPRWNISLLHYRAQGEIGANVLVGIQIEKNNIEEFEREAKYLGYEYTYEMENDGYKLLMQ